MESRCKDDGIDRMLASVRGPDRRLRYSFNTLRDEIDVRFLEHPIPIGVLERPFAERWIVRGHLGEQVRIVTDLLVEVTEPELANVVVLLRNRQAAGPGRISLK